MLAAGTTFLLEVVNRGRLGKQCSCRLIVLSTRLAQLRSHQHQAQILGQGFRALSRFRQGLIRRLRHRHRRIQDCLIRMRRRCADPVSRLLSNPSRHD